MLQNGIRQHVRCFKRMISNYLNSDHFVFSPEVKECLLQQKPIVALESAIITHGMPHPTNFRTAVEVENIIRSNDVTPATIAVMHGKIHVGLDEDQLQTLSTSKDRTHKISRRDLAVIMSQNMTGGTTVSATMLIAHRVGISVFVTGGLGGVHRDAEITFDVSADLTELGRTPIAVVSSGVKSILDIEKTLEYLETEGVTVISFSDSKEFPSFFTSRSGFKSPYNVSNAKDAAKIIATNHELKLESGLLFAVPIPESHDVDGVLIDTTIQTAIDKAKKSGIKGKDTTPYILEQVNQLTEGKSLSANIALIKNNAYVGSKIALELNKLKYDAQSRPHYSRQRNQGKAVQNIQKPQ